MNDSITTSTLLVTQNSHIVTCTMVSGNLTIEALPNDVLLLVYSLCDPRDHADKLVTWQWCRLTHVCQRWRRIVFTSPRFLGLVIVTGNSDQRGSVRRALDCWPALPIAIRRGSREALRMPDVDKNDILAGLKHPDRIYEISFSISWHMLEKLATLAWRFPQLERLEIRGARGQYNITYPLLVDSWAAQLQPPTSYATSNSRRSPFLPCHSYLCPTAISCILR